MPSWFSARQPDEDKLAGKIDSPTSPAEKYSPVAISNTKSIGRDSSTGTSGSGATTTLAGNSNSPTYKSATDGSAAQANGYQTGPYQTSNSYVQQNQDSLGQTPTNSLASTPLGQSSSSFVSPYGGTYTGVNANNTTTPNVNIAAGPSNSSPSSGLPQFTGGTSSGSISNSGFDPTGVAGVDSMPPIPSYPSLEGSFASAGAGSANTPAASAYQAAPNSSYAPGTTGRSTSYNFGVGATTTPSQTLPSNTASGDQLLMR